MTRYEAAKNRGFDKALQQLQEIKSIDPTFEVDSSLVADAYEGLGRYYSSVATRIDGQSGQVLKINYTKALDYHQQALRIRQRLYSKDHEKIALSYYYIGQCYRGFSNGITPEQRAINPIQEERRYLQRALNMQLKTLGGLHYQTANTYQALGNFFYETQQDYHQGFAYHKEAFDIRQQLFDDNHPQIAASYINLATYYRVMNIYDRELTYLEKALQIQLSILGTEHAEIAKSYYLLANRYRSSGAIEKALSYYSHVLYISEELGQAVSAEVANTHLAMAACYRALDRMNRVWEELQRSQTLFERVYGAQHFQLSKVLSAKGDYYLDRGAYDSSAYFYNKALQINKKQLGHQHYAVAKGYDKLSNLYALLGRETEERKYLLLALAIRKAEAYLLLAKGQEQHASYLTLEGQELRNSSLRQQLHNSYRDLANYYKRQEDYATALQYIQLALSAVCESVEPYQEDWSYNPTTEELARNAEWLQTLSTKASLLLDYYHLQEDPRLLQLAYQTYHQGIAVINGLRTTFQSDKARQKLRTYSVPIFEGAIRCSYLYHSQQTSKAHLAQAFEVAELSKNFILLQGLQNNLARGNSNIPNKLLEQERALRERLAYYSNYNNRGHQNNQAYDRAYLRTKQQYDSLIQQLEQHYPRYYDLKYQTAVIGLEEVQAHLGNNQQVLLEYFVGEQYLYAFRITGDSCHLFEMKVPSNYERLVYNLRSTLTNYEMIAEHPKWAFQAFAVASHRFHSYFVAPFLPKDYKAEQLIVIADAMLHYIPFEAVLCEVPTEQQLEESNYKALAFLMKRFAVSYNYSATLWNKNLQRDKLNNNGRCLGLAPSIQFSEQHDSLPWTQKELEAIQYIYPGDYYYGKEASKSLFQREASAYNIIHLATHGIVNMQNPMRSMLYFGDGEQDLSALYAYEIHNLSLRANLVVLSACETGFGRTIRGEGVSSLARAFLFAGTPSVVTTLWEVNDFTSAALIELFYSNLSKGMSKAEALRRAKLDFLSKTDEISGHPTYWASFITLGDASPLPSYWKGWYWVLGGSVLFLLTASIVWGWQWYKKKTILP